MEGPAVCSALIHAATLVMAGIIAFSFFSELSSGVEADTLF